MAVICADCCRRKQISRPPVRVRKAPCDFCGGYDELGQRQGGKNYDIPDSQIPGHRTNLDTIAEREEMQNGGS